MISAIVMLFIIGFGESAVKWNELPNFYLRSSLGSSTVGMSLKYAAGIDPELRKIDYEALGKRCEATNALWQKTLNPQEVAAVSCYTRDTILYRRINYALRALDESLLTAYTPFLKIFHRGVAKLEHDEFEYNIYRGDDSDYGFHQENSVVTLPLSFTASEEYARNKAGNASEGSCTIAILLANSGRLIEDYTSVPGEYEVIMLPGTIARITQIIPQNKTHCRTFYLQEINETVAVPVKSLIPPYMPRLADTNKKDSSFLRDYYKPAALVQVLKTEILSINTAGGYGDAYNPWPYITTIAYGQKHPSISLTVGQILIAVNQHFTRGMSHNEVEQLLKNAKADHQRYTNYTVAVR